MIRFFLAVTAGFAGFVLGLWVQDIDVTSPEEIRRILGDPKSIPMSAWLIALVAFLLVAAVPALLTAAKRAVPTAQPGTPTQTKASDSPSGSAKQLLSEENRHLCLALSSITFFTVRFFTVPQGWTFTITAFGKYLRLVPPGLAYCVSLWGLYQRIGMAVPQMEQMDTFDEESVFTSDGVHCLIDVMVCYRVVNPEAAIYQVSDYRAAIRQLVQAVLRNECGKGTTRNLLSGREAMTESLRESLASDVQPWGISVRLVEITNIQIPKETK